MAVSLKHTTQAVGTDAGNGEIRKAQWNEEHTLSLATGKLLGRSTAGTGAAEEITPSTGLTLSGGNLAVSTIPVANGGTNISSYTTGDILFASAAGVLSPLADAATGNALISGGVGVAPSYGKIGLTTHVSGTLPLANGGTGATTGAGAFANMMGYTATATAASTTILTNTSTQYQLFTGTLTQIIRLPVTSTLTTGWTFHIVNNSTDNLTVRSSGDNTICTIFPQMTAMVTCIATTTTLATDWEFGFTDFGFLTGTGAVVLGTGPTITTPILSGNVGAGGTSYGTAGQVLTSGGTGANTSWADAPPNLVPFTSSGTWTKPAGARLVLVRVWGAGGGGAGGAVGAAAVAKSGGSGGAGGAYYEKYFYPSVLSATVVVTVGTAGTGGASNTVGVIGGNSSFGAYITCGGGGGGVLLGGTNGGGGAQAAGSAASSLTVPTLTGGSASAAYYGGGGGGSGSAGFSSQYGGGGGGSGGGESSVNVLSTPTAGGQSNYNTGVGTAGTSVAGAPTAGGAATGAGCGGGGGGSAQTANGAAGGAGGFPGGGGGGGGSTRTGFLGGAGGAGGAGYVEVYTW